MKIYKYPLNVVEHQILLMPLEAKILHINVQNDVICIWALVNEKNKNEEVEIEIIGTGQTMDPLIIREYIGTVFMGGFVWHVFKQLW